MKTELRQNEQMRDSGVQWIGYYPSDWNTVPLKYDFIIGNGSNPLTDEGPTPVYGSGANSFKTCQESKDGPTILLGRKGTINAPQWIDGNYWNVDTAYDVKCKPNSNVLLKYLYYCAICFDYDRYTTKTSLPSMTQSTYYNYRIPNIPESVQKGIIDYLDDRCSRIDEVIAEATASIEEYKELKQAVIFEAVTKGLNKQVSLQDSGIPWIGCIPSSWQITKLGRYVNILPGYAFSSSDFASEGIPLLRGINVTPDGLRWDETVYWNSDTNFLTQFYLKEGDIVVGLDRPWIKEGMRAWIIEGSDLPCLLLQRVCRIRCTNNALNSFVFYWLRSKIFEDALVADTTGISVPHISSNQIAEFKMAFPKIDEQLRIVKYLDEQMRSLNELIKEKQSLIADLQSYKKSLIYEVVTGKRRVV